MMLPRHDRRSSVLDLNVLAQLNSRRRFEKKKEKKVTRPRHKVVNRLLFEEKIFRESLKTSFPKHNRRSASIPLNVLSDLVLRQASEKVAEEARTNVRKEIDNVTESTKGDDSTGNIIIGSTKLDVSSPTNVMVSFFQHSSTIRRRRSSSGCA